MIITIDGPAGAGKSTVARGLAERLGFELLDTGAMYRAVAHGCLEREIDFRDEPAVCELARSLKLQVSGSTVFCNGRDVTREIRSEAVSEKSSVVAAIEGVREAMVVLQRQAAQGRRIVTEGRDQGTVVFPNAECKFFVTADAGVRAQRRQEEMASRGQEFSIDEVKRQIEERDFRDLKRKVAPLRKPEDAAVIVTSNQTADEAIAEMESVAREKLHLPATD